MIQHGPRLMLPPLEFLMPSPSSFSIPSSTFFIVRDNYLLSRQLPLSAPLELEHGDISKRESEECRQDMWGFPSIAALHASPIFIFCIWIFKFFIYILIYYNISKNVVIIDISLPLCLVNKGMILFIFFF